MIELQRDDGVLTVWVNRPEAKNALNLDMVRALRAALTHDSEVRVIVLKSRVPGVFSIGMDLAALQAGIAGGVTSPQIYEAVRDYVALLQDLCAARCPTIAAVGGIAVGGGVDLVAACDLVVASDAAAFSIAQLRKGIFPLTTSGVVVPRIGEREFLAWLLSGQNWSAAKARKLGLVSHVVPAAELDARVAELTRQIVRFDADALRLGMDALRAGRNLTPVARLEHLGALLALNCQIPRGATKS
jgi:methylglutaconyl-CoA hydratase